LQDNLAFIKGFPCPLSCLVTPNMVEKGENRIYQYIITYIVKLCSLEWETSSFKKVKKYTPKCN
jgi:hypothetical protein